MSCFNSSFLAEYLSGECREECVEVLRVCHELKNKLNDPCSRGAKSKIVDAEFAAMIPNMEYVDEPGYDWLFCGEDRVEGKTQKKMFQKGGWTNQVTLKNTRSEYEQGIEKKDFDLLILTQTSAPYAMAVASYDDIRRYMRPTRDSIKLQVPFSVLKFIVHPDEGLDFEEESEPMTNDQVIQLLRMGTLKKYRNAQVWA